MKKILVDARMVSAEGHGIGHYVCDLAAALALETKSYELEFLVSAQLPKNHALREFRCHPTDISFLHPRETLSLGAAIRAREPALYHSPSFSSLARYPCPHLQTVHDLNHLRYGSFLQKAYYRALLLPSMKSALFLLTVSESAKTEISSWLTKHSAQKEIFVAKNVIAKCTERDDSILTRLQLEPKKYFFCLSNPKPHKNLDMLVRAHAEAGDSVLPLVLSVSGPSSSRMLRVGHLQAKERNSLLAQAKAFYFPSLYEGFGRPPLEAALAGTLPIASDIAPHREGLHGIKEAIFHDPKNREAWKKSFQENTSGPAQEISETSKNWIEREYSLEKLGATMNDLYSRALGRKL